MFLRLRWATFLLPRAVYAICTVSQTLDPLIFATIAPSPTTAITTDLTLSGTWTFISCASATITRQDIIILDGTQFSPVSRRFGNFGNFGTVFSLVAAPQTQVIVFRYTSVTLNMALATHTADISWTFLGTGTDYPVSGVHTTAFSMNFGPTNQFIATSTTNPLTVPPAAPITTDTGTLTDVVGGTLAQTIILTSISLIPTTLSPSRSRTRFWSPTADPPAPAAPSSQPTGLSEGIIGVIAGIAGLVVLTAILVGAFLLYKFYTRRQNHPLNPLLVHPIEVEMDERTNKDVNSTSSLGRMGHAKGGRPLSASLRYPDARVYNQNSGRLRTEAKY